MQTSPCLRLALLFAVLLPFDLSAATTSLVQHGDAWRYHKGTNAPQAGWKVDSDAALDDTWATGNGGFGFADNVPETVDCQTLLEDMLNQYTTVYVRKEFTISSAVNPTDHLMLRMDWDDGYLAWLDGVFLTNANYDLAPTEPPPVNVASSNHESSHGNGTPSSIVDNDLGPVAGRLGVGTHVLAIVGLNSANSSSDFILVPDLYVSGPTPGISGTIDTDTTWIAADSPYTVTGDVTVGAGVTLTIEPGVMVQFNPGTGMTIHGRLLADGTESEPIRFTRAASGTWNRLLFVQAAPSRLRHCIVEYSNCAGDHKDYYDDDCNDATVPPSRTYFQAVVAVACHLDIEYCRFENLPGPGGEGDAIAIISDDPDIPGEATGTVRFCTFTDIGQGVHTRFAFVVIERNFFTSHNGDNDDVDIYGESLPPSLVLYNRLVSSADDMMNPTRSSAILIGNEVGNSGDSGVVLRDSGRPVMINNIIYNCPSAGIDVQNRCKAILLNNTVVACGTAINFRDHTTRHEAPYCLFPGSGQATIVNCTLWDCTRSLNLVNSPEPPELDSHATVMYSNVEGGQAGVAVASGGSTLTWGPGNIDLDPQFTNEAGRDYHLTAASPCIDSGTNFSISFPITNRLGVVAMVDISVTNDIEGIGRPLDGDGNGTARFDIGAYEYLLPTADSNGDGVPDGWYVSYELNPADPAVGSMNPDGDPHTTAEEWVADTDPTDGKSYFRMQSLSNAPPARVQFQSSASRVYTLLCKSAVGPGGVFSPVTGSTDVPGTGGLQTLTDATGGDAKFYIIRVTVP